ncbi:hypothetical protein [Roseimaritima ulvae]|uniref:Secreted protein n=1 Tax=Roseimaritima ulvae TaxID=980254 RepID=A0A5B9QQG4_9BACT|nr:hypothetical protein [Roseimaritima ulvae]QEG41248.1 hypothetical protein UC8_32670 [Roseimaritima ulvae]
MKKSQNSKRQIGAIAGAGVVFAALLALSLQSLAFAQESTQETNDRGNETESKPMCPMMAGLKGIKLTADSPPLLMAQADELKLTEEQKQELKSIAEEAQRKAADVLTADQKSMIGKSPDRAMSMMEIAMMRSKGVKGDKSGDMCPMCMKKMDGMKKMMMDRKKNGGRETTSN